MFREHNWAQEEVKIVGTQEIGVGGRSSEAIVEITVLKDFHNVEVTPRIDIDNIVEGNGEVSD